MDAERIEVQGWRGMIGHNWGVEHAERWVWVQGCAFEGRSPEDYFDMAVGRIKVGGATTPWVGNAMLMLDGTPHRLGGFGHIPSTEISEQPTSARFGLKGKGVAVSGSVRAPAKDFVAWIYADPVVGGRDRWSGRRPDRLRGGDGGEGLGRLVGSLTAG